MPASPPADARIDADLTVIVGGMYSPPHLGPDAYAELAARVQAAPDAYLDHWAARYLAPDAMDLLHEGLLRETLPLRHGKVRSLAACLVERREALLAAPPPNADANYERRMRDKHHQAYRIAIGAGDEMTLLHPLGVCREVNGALRVQSCGCGEATWTACEAILRNGRVDLAAVARTTGRCRDCVGIEVACRTPRQDLPISVMGGDVAPVAPCPARQVPVP